MRVLGVDFGGKRIGLAVGETDPGIATPRPSLASSGALKRDAQAIQELARREEAAKIIVGVPYNPEGDDRMARICQLLASHLMEIGCEVELVDESLTSVAAEDTLRGVGMKAAARRRYVDGEAAALILERYFLGAKA